MKDKKKSLKNIVVFALSAIMAVSVFTGCGVSKQKTPIKPNTSQSQSQSQNKNKPSKKQPGINKDKKNPASSGATNQKEIETKMKELLEQRRKKQPLEYPSAGSTFKRPEGYFVGKIIDDLELKGYTIGGAQVSEKHGGFIINKGNATAKDVKDLIEYIVNKVKKEYNIVLEPEVKMI
jgi:UDP-N-acetylenolpyruvoylglucosamine reductase